MFLRVFRSLEFELGACEGGVCSDIFPNDCFAIGKNREREREREKERVLILSWDVIFRKFGLKIRVIFVKNRRAGRCINDSSWESFNYFCIVMIFVRISGYYFTFSEAGN